MNIQNYEYPVFVNIMNKGRKYAGEVVGEGEQLPGLWANFQKTG